MPLQDRLEKIRSSPAPRNEESAKIQVVVPILQSLGWDPSEILPEHRVGEMSRRGRVDIALKTQGRILGLIEAKAPGTRLEGHVDQVLGYAFYESVEICALTTGLEWWFYLPGARVPVPQRRFAVLEIMDTPIGRLCKDLTLFLGKESLLNGEAEEQAKLRLESARLNSEVPRIWKQMLQEPDDELVGLVQRRVHEKAHLQLTSEQVTAALQGSRIRPTVTAPEAGDESAIAAALQGSPIPPATGHHDRNLGPTDGTHRRKPRRSAKPVAMELWGERYEVKSHVEALRKVLDVLHERHRAEFHRVLELKGRQYPYASRDIDRLKPDAQTYHYEQPSSGYFFDTWLTASGCKKRAGQFLTHFGHDPAGFQVLYD